jgi:hypothetical protein
MTFTGSFRREQAGVVPVINEHEASKTRCGFCEASRPETVFAWRTTASIAVRCDRPNIANYRDAVMMGFTQ